MRSRRPPCPALSAAGIALGTDRAAAEAATPGRERRKTAASLAAAGRCLRLTPTQQQGPFYVAYDRVREDIRGGQDGIPLLLHIRVIDVSTSRPVQPAALGPRGR